MRQVLPGLKAVSNLFPSTLTFFGQHTEHTGDPAFPPRTRTGNYEHFMSIVTSLSQWRFFRKSTEGKQGERTGTQTSHLKCFQVLKNQYSSDKTGRSQAKAHLIYNLHVQLLFRLKGIIIWRRFVHRAQWRVELRFPNFLLDFDKVDCRGKHGSS